MKQQFFSMPRRWLPKFFSTLAKKQPYEKVNKITRELARKHTGYDKLKLVATINNCIGQRKTTWRNHVEHRLPLPQHYNLIAADPWWKTKQTHTFWPLTYQFNSGAFKYAWTAYRCTTDSFGNIDISNPWTMLCFPSQHYSLPLKKFYNTPKVIQREFNLNRELNQVHPGFTPRPCLYHGHDKHGNRLNTPLTIFPVRYVGPDLITVINELEFNLAERRRWFIYCYLELYRILKDLHINHNIRHGDIKPENVCLTQQADNQSPPRFQYIDFGFSQPLHKESELGLYDDLPQTASLLEALLEVYQTGFSAEEYASLSEHLLGLKQAPAGATIDFWTQLLTEGNRQLPATLMEACHKPLSVPLLRPQKLAGMATTEEPYVDNVLGIK